jgi:hypothetical protein
MNRGDVREQALVDGSALLAQRGKRTLQVDGIPQDDRGHDEIEATGAMPLLLIGAIAQFTGVYATLGMTGDGRLLALGPDPDDDVSAHIDFKDFKSLLGKAPPVLWMWDTQTGRWAVARTRLPCLNPQQCYGRWYDTFGVSVSAGAPSQPPGTWFWIGAGEAESATMRDFRIFIPGT